MSTKLDDLIQKIPDGPFWLTGETWRQIVQAILEDRAVLAPGCGDEIPTPDGRVFNVRAGDVPRTNVFIGVAGIVRSADAAIFISPEL